MKTIAKGLFLFIAIFFLMHSGCLQSTETQKLPVVSVNVNGFGKELSITKGRTFKITLPDHVDGGYRFDKAQYDDGILTLDNHWEKLPGENSAKGESGVAVWQFTAIKSGITRLKFTESRPWKNGGTVIVFENSVVVK